MTHCPLLESVTVSMGLKVLGSKTYRKTFLIDRQRLPANPTLFSKPAK